MGIFASKNATTNLSNNKSEADKSEIPVFNKAQFYEKLNRQNWSLPDSLIFYLTKNPNKTAVYQKMTKSCKYFFAENPIICISDLSYGNGKWKTTCNEKPFEWGNIKSKFWITNELEIRSYSSTPNFASTFLHKIYKCEAKTFYFYNQIISFNDFIFLSSSVEKIYFNNVTVENEEGLIVALEKLVATCSKLKDFTYHFGEINSPITVNTIKELLKIPHFLKLEGLCLSNISEEFDIETFYAYMKKNKKTRFHLCFDNSISEAYKSRLEEIVDEIFRKKILKFLHFRWICKCVWRYKPVFIYFPGLPFQKYNLLYWMCYLKLLNAP